jgi:hypothetical protein
MQRLETAALDLFAFDRIRSEEEVCDRFGDVGADRVRTTFERMLAGGVAAAVVGDIGRAAGERARQALKGLARG